MSYHPHQAESQKSSLNRSEFVRELLTRVDNDRFGSEKNIIVLKSWETMIIDYDEALTGFRYTIKVYLFQSFSSISVHAKALRIC